MASSNEEYTLTRMSFEEHLKELKYRVKISLITVGVVTLALMIVPADLSFIENPLVFYKPLISVILEYIRAYTLPKEVELVGIRFLAPIELYLFSSLILGFIISMPVIAYEAYKFIDPALYPHEKKLIYPFTLAFSTLFTIGALFGIFLVIPFLLKASLLFHEIVGATPLIYITDFYSLVLHIALFSGLAFSFPAVFVLLVRLGFLSTSIIEGKRPIVYFIIYLLTAIITPDGGLIANFILFVPIVLLMEVAVKIAKKYEKERQIPRRSIFTKVIEPIKCPYCKQTIPGNSIFCPKCGKSIK